MYSDKFKNITNMLKIFDEYSIVHFDENLVLFSVDNNEENLDSNKNLISKSKKRPKKKSNFYVYNNEKMFFNELVNLVGKIIDKDGVLIGYLFGLTSINSRRFAENKLEDYEYKNGLVVYLVNQDIDKTIESFFDEDNIGNNFSRGYFICGELDLEQGKMIEDSCAEIINNIRLFDFNTDLILKFNNKKYRFTNDVWNDTMIKVEYSNIGIFLEI